MRLPIVMGVLATISTSIPALADQYSCETVDDNATAFVRTGLPVSIVETNKTCEIAVDGTIASGRSQNFVGAMNGLSDTLFFSEDLPYEFPREMLRDMIAGPFGDRNNREGGAWAGLVQDQITEEAVFGLSQCIRDFADILADNDFNGAEVPLTQMGMMTDGPLECVVVPPLSEQQPAPGEPTIENGALRLSFSAPEVMLTLYLPADWLRDARDGNGIFN
jgi:hypothetical protein